MKRVARKRLGSVLGAGLAIVTGGIAVSFAVLAFGLGGPTAPHDGLAPIIPNGGSRFTLRLPAAEPVSPEEASEGASAARRLGQEVAQLTVGAEPPAPSELITDVANSSPPASSGAAEGEGRDRGMDLAAFGPSDPSPPGGAGAGSGNKPDSSNPVQNPNGNEGAPGDGPPNDDPAKNQNADSPTKEEVEENGKVKPPKERPHPDEPRGDDDSSSNGGEPDDSQGSGGNSSGGNSGNASDVDTGNSSGGDDSGADDSEGSSGEGNTGGSEGDESKPKGEGNQDDTGGDPDGEDGEDSGDGSGKVLAPPESAAAPEGNSPAAEVAGASEAVSAEVPASTLATETVTPESATTAGVTELVPKPGSTPVPGAGE
jgi:hypothetical protein